MVVDFKTVFSEELEAVNFRRRAIRAGKVAAARKGASPEGPADTASEGAANGHLRSERRTLSVPDGAAADDTSVSGTLGRVADLTGLALSGGGVRSASFCLGVLQGLDSLSDHGDPHVLDGIDYLSTVSGGGYIGTSLVAGMQQKDYSFPFRSRLDEEETPETQHLRDYSNFLVPDGTIDYLTSAALVVRGLVVNAVIVLPALLFLAAATVLFKPVASDLTTHCLFGGGICLLRDLDAFPLTKFAAAGLALVLFVSALYTSISYNKGSVAKRVRFGRVLALVLLVPFAAAIFELQPLVLDGMFKAATEKQAHAADASKVAAADSQAPGGAEVGAGAAVKPGPEDAVLKAVGNLVPALAMVVLPVAASLIAMAQRLANIAKATFGETTWNAFFKKYASRLAIYVAAVVAPLTLWIAYIYLCFWAVTPLERQPAQTPDWLAAVTNALTNGGAWHVPGLTGVATTYVLAMLAALILCLFIGPNANSLHRLYRDRLNAAFVFKRPTSDWPPEKADRLRFCELKPKEGASFAPHAATAPFLLVNTAINLEASRDLNKRGRNADVFTFSPLHAGSQATGYVDMAKMEATVPDLTLPMAMATSGAAASANMGGATVKLLTFSLSLLNIRLGYWLANPKRIADFKTWRRYWANVGTWYFAKETAGQLDEDTLNVYLTDGGHVENLGVYELLKRRCKVILAVDAECDAGMTFPSFVNLQVMARIDLGVRIDLPWEAIQTRALGVTPTSLRGAGEMREGPHAAIGKISYDDAQSGVLIYIKSSLSGDENDYIRDYKRQNSTFPHETTADQFFTEEQFEAYRALGFHIARNLFTGEDDCALSAKATSADVKDIAAALALLNVPESSAGDMIARLSARIT